MRLFSPLYARAMQSARHRHAPAHLGGMSFAESSFFPVPPDVMLAPMCLARPERAWNLALHRDVDRLGWAAVALVAASLLIIQA